MFNTEQLSKMSTDEKRILAKQLIQNNNAPGKPLLATSKEVPEAFYKFELFPEFKQLETHASIMENIGVKNPYFNCREGVSNNTILIDGKDYINYSGYNYLGLSGHPEINKAAKAAVDKFGTSASASRIVSGEFTLHRELEAELTKFTGTEDSVVTVSGYGTNVSTIGHLMGPKDLIMHDSLIHNSIMSGCLLSGARRVPFPHNDYKALDRLLTENRHRHEKVLIIIEGVYSMDGDIPDLAAVIEIKKRHQSLLMVDEAHSAGVLGEKGTGLAEYFAIDPAEVDIWMGTLSKSFASCGGYIAGSKALIQNLKYNAPGGILYSVGISPANTAAALAALKIIQKEPERVDQLRACSALFLKEAKKRGLDTGPSANSPVIPVILGNSVECLKLGDLLFEQGINVQAILYPAVPEEESRLRFFITALHTEEQIIYTLDAVSNTLKSMRQKTAA
ncbi:MAG: aminotransferase class I/II-fold pyridoxal phosphate-dependent enzyme [Methylococcaceae bacterium]